MLIQLAVILASTATLSIKGTQLDLKTQLQSLEEASWVAWQHHDGAFFERFLSEDHVELGAFGAASKQSVVRVVRSSSCIVKSYSITQFTLVQFDSTTALLHYHAKQDTICGSSHVPSPVWVSSLFKKRGYRWVNVLYQQTQDLTSHR